MWLLITTGLGFFAGWFELQGRFAANSTERPLLTLKRQSGSMGLGVSLGGILTLKAYRDGLGISIWRVFGPFQKPLLIPWDEIEAHAGRNLLIPRTKLFLGKPHFGTLQISARSWAKLVASVEKTSGQSKPLLKVEPTGQGALAQALLVQWLVLTGLMGTFFALAQRLLDADEGLPLALCFAFPAVVVGIDHIIRFIRES